MNKQSSRDSAGACGRAQELLGTNIAANLQLVVQVAKEYTEQLGAGKIIEMLEAHKSYHGLYYYLGSHIAFSEDPEARRLPACLCYKPQILHLRNAMHSASASESRRGYNCRCI